MRAVTFTLVLLVCFFASTLNATTYYVKQGATGNGTSWANAFGSLQSALAKAVAGDQIWVAAGKYTPTNTTDRTISFEIADGVQVYGGFAGNETSLNQRNWTVNKTILSGEIGSPAIDDNSYTVIYTKNVSAATIVSGFTIMGGAANGLGAIGNRERCGGAWFNDGENGSSNPTIENCIFTRNTGRDGAGLYNYAKNGSCAPRITNCQFDNNKADLDGGAIYNDGRMGTCAPIIKNCVISNNAATYGGGVLNIATDGTCTPSIVSCNFEDNIGYIRGASMYCSEDGGFCKPTVVSSVFSDNRATVGKDIYNDPNYQRNQENTSSRGTLTTTRS